MQVGIIPDRCPHSDQVVPIRFDCADLDLHRKLGFIGWAQYSPPARPITVRLMRSAIFLTFSLFFSAISCQSPAREIERMQFGGPVIPARETTMFKEEAQFSHADNVSQSLLAQFAFSAITGTFTADLTIDSFSIKDECDTGSYRPTWWLTRVAELRRASYHQVLTDIACRHGIPTRLLDAVIAQESGFASGSISRAGAMGIMQIMPDTARSLGLTKPFDPIANMYAGARYLRQQIDRFGRIDLALAAYNAGPERRSLKHGRIPAIPETQHYVRTILTNWGRLIELDQPNAREPDRGELAMLAVRASGYRDVELIRYDGLNASNPM